MFLFNLVNKFLMRDFSELIIKNFKTKNPVIFDFGCFMGSFSINLQKKLNLKNNNFYLFDANPNLKIKDLNIII